MCWRRWRLRPDRYSRLPFLYAALHGTGREELHVRLGMVGREGRVGDMWTYRPQRTHFPATSPLGASFPHVRTIVDTVDG